jgi:hypothetical protein
MKANDVIAVGVDGSEGSTRALDWAAGGAAARGGSVSEERIRTADCPVVVIPNPAERPGPARERPSFAPQPRARRVPAVIRPSGPRW